MQTTRKTHQNKVIKKTLEYISKSRNIVCKIIDYPDEKERKLPACDALALVNGEKIAIEHTSIDSFPFQRRDDSRFRALLGPLIKELTGKLPLPGKYQLVIDMDVIPTGINWNEVRSKIRAWCQKVAHSLELGSPSVAPKHFIRTKLPGVPFEVSLYRWQFRDGEFSVARFAPSDLKNKRFKAMRQSLLSRGTKISDYKDRGFRTMLILESNDIALGNFSDIEKAFIDAVHHGGLKKLPDEIYLVETEAMPYYFYCLKIDDMLLPD